MPIFHFLNTRTPSNSQPFDGLFSNALYAGFLLAKGCTTNAQFHVTQGTPATPLITRGDEPNEQHQYTGGKALNESAGQSTLFTLLLVGPSYTRRVVRPPPDAFVGASALTRAGASAPAPAVVATPMSFLEAKSDAAVVVPKQVCVCMRPGVCVLILALVAVLVGSSSASSFVVGGVRIVVDVGVGVSTCGVLVLGAGLVLLRSTTVAASLFSFVIVFIGRCCVILPTHVAECLASLVNDLGAKQNNPRYGCSFDYRDTVTRR